MCSTIAKLHIFILHRDFNELISFRLELFFTVLMWNRNNFCMFYFSWTYFTWRYLSNSNIFHRNVVHSELYIEMFSCRLVPVSGNCFSSRKYR